MDPFLVLDMSHNPRIHVLVFQIHSEDIRRCSRNNVSKTREQRIEARTGSADMAEDPRHSAQQPSRSVRQSGALRDCERSGWLEKA